MLQKTEVDFPEESTSLTPAVKTSKTAIAFVTRALDDCKAIRLEHLLQTISTEFDVWVLHNHDQMEISNETQALQLQTSLDLIQQLEQRHPNLYTESQKNEAIDVFDDAISGAAQSSFVRWVVKQHEYNHSWVMEDDVLFTGQWSHFFEAVQHKEEGMDADIDIVATLGKRSKEWVHFYWCRIDKKYISFVEKDTKEPTNSTTVPCIQVLQWAGLWSLARVSNRWAHYLLNDLQSGVLVGFHETVFQALEMGHADLKNMTFPSHVVGHHEAGSWGPYWDKTKCSLEMKEHQPVEANRLYHPLKCEAYAGDRFHKLKELLVSYGWNNTREA
ncbi:MAG: hypothetical protein SGILL_000862 [Bacillariaceae sp.]